MTFEKGQSGNPVGRPKALRELEEAARALTPTALDTLVRIAADRTAPPAAQVSAATALLDRAWGRPRQAVETNGWVAFRLSELIARSYEPLPQANDSADGGRLIEVD